MESRQMVFLIPPLFLALVLASALANNTQSLQEIVHWISNTTTSPVSPLATAGAKDTEPGKGGSADSNSSIENTSNGLTLGFVLGIIAGGGVLVVFFGYLIGSITFFAINLFDCFLRKCGCPRTIQCGVRDDRKAAIGEAVGIPAGFYPKEHIFYFASALQHGILPEETRQWIERRWAIFLTAIHCITAFFLFLIGLILANIAVLKNVIELGWIWWIVWIIFCVVLLFNAFVAWSEVRTMTEFLSICKNVRRNPTR